MWMKVLAPLVIILGLFVLYLGYTVLTRDTVQCGSHTMKAGETCTTPDYRRGPHTRNFNEQRGADRAQGLILMGVGATVTVVGGVWHLRGYRRQD